MRRHPMLRAAAVLLVLVLALLAAGGPNEAGALAGVGGSGVGTAVGLAWILVFPLMVLMVPPLLFSAVAEGLHGLCRRDPDDGLGSRSVPGRHSRQWSRLRRRSGGTKFAG
ncbi:MAG: hypothetical protein ACE37F_12265 [Nannocystaceae bacterium]|nr:hypothetical protein [bacterium]